MSDTIFYVHSFSALLFTWKQCAYTFENRFKAQGVHMDAIHLTNRKPESNVNWGFEKKINKRGTDITLDTSLRYVSSISPSPWSTDRFYGPDNFLVNLHYRTVIFKVHILLQ